MADTRKLTMVFTLDNGYDFNYNFAAPKDELTMAVKKNAECEIIIKVETGTTSTGKASYSSRSFGYINPSLAEDDI